MTIGVSVVHEQQSYALAFVVRERTMPANPQLHIVSGVTDNPKNNLKTEILK